MRSPLFTINLTFTTKSHDLQCYFHKGLWIPLSFEILFCFPIPLEGSSSFVNSVNDTLFGRNRPTSHFLCVRSTPKRVQIDEGEYVSGTSEPGRVFDFRQVIPPSCLHHCLLTLFPP